MAHEAELPLPELHGRAGETFRTRLGVTAELFRRGLPHVALALDIWQAYVRQQGSAGEWLTSDRLTALLVLNGLSRDTARRAKAAGAGLVWDAFRLPHDRRCLIWHLRGMHTLRWSLGVRTLGKWITLPPPAYRSLDSYIIHASAVIAAFEGERPGAMTAADENAGG